MIGRRGRRSACAVAMALAGAAVLASPVFAATESTAAEGGAGDGSLAGGFPGAALSYWTQARLESAKALPIVTLPGSPPGEGRTAALGTRVAARTAAIEGTEIGEAESTLFPNNVNGKLFGRFEIPVGPKEVKVENYQCSAGVIPSRRGNLILTAAHCVIDPGTGKVASEGSVIFIPGYRNGVGPYGAWEAESYTTTESWRKAAKAPPNEGEDLALLELGDNKTGESVEGAVGYSLGIDFDQACSQSYTQFGYPAESPYNGEILYSHVAAYAGTDTNPAILPRPVKIASDFTRGASGGPWTIGSSGVPTAVSLTAYGYEGQPGYLYGPYFGETARKVYERASGVRVPVGIEETCNLLPETPPPTQSSPSPPSPPQPVEPPKTRVTLKVKKVRHRADGSAVLIAKVSAAGRLKLTGAAVRVDTVTTQSAGKYRLAVAAKGRAGKMLRRKGRAKVQVKVAFSASGKTRRVSRSIRLARRPVGRSTRPPAK